MAAEVLDRCRSFLESDPARHNVFLTLLHDRVETGIEGRYWWVLDGDGSAHGGVVGFCLQTPFAMLAGVSPMTSGALDVLVPAVVEAAGDLPGVVGEARAAAGFAGRFATSRKLGAEPIEGQRLYRLGTLVAPAGVAGSLRLARTEEGELVDEWAAGFGRDTGTSDRADLATARRHLEAGRLYVWEVQGEAVAMVTRTIAVAGTARISFVYTPPEQRRRGYAGACTAAVSQQCLDTDATSCVLYTQLSNPTSNSVYQRIGFEPVMEVVRYHFG